MVTSQLITYDIWSTFYLACFVLYDLISVIPSSPIPNLVCFDYSKLHELLKSFDLWRLETIDMTFQVPFKIYNTWKQNSKWKCLEAVNITLKMYCVYFSFFCYSFIQSLNYNHSWVLPSNWSYQHQYVVKNLF